VETAAAPTSIISLVPEVMIAGQGVDTAARPTGNGTKSTALSGMAAALYNAANVTVSEEIETLAAAVGNNGLAIGFLGYDYYLAHIEQLRAVAIRLPDGQLVGPNATSVVSGLYPLARPLYLYTSPAVLRANPDVERFIACYLNQLPQLVQGRGYLLPNRELFAEAMQSFNASCQDCRRAMAETHPLADVVPICEPTGAAGASITVVGSSTLLPLSQQMATQFVEQGFPGTVALTSSGTGAGFQTFCGEGQGDIVGASRPVTASERAACSAIGRSLAPFPIAVDALVVVVSRENSFLEETSLEELQQIFVHARQWSEINSAWPAAPIFRMIPDAQSGTFDYFVAAVLEGQALTDLTARRLNPLAEPTGPAVPTAATPTSAPVGSGVFLNNQPDVRLGYVDRGDNCAINTALAALIMEQRFGLRVTAVAFPDAEALFKALSAKVADERVDLTFCYHEPADRSYRQRYFSYTEFIGSGYQQTASERYVIVSNNTVKAPLERTNVCLYRFLNSLNWNELDLQNQDLMLWYAANQSLIDSWASCN
jgi:ABC-type phosphate transport system substrate-binding protein